MMDTKTKRKIRTRARIEGTSQRPRCCVFRSSKHMYAQLINDEASKTLLAVSDRSLPKATVAKKKPIELASLVGEFLAAQAAKQGLTAIVFDRGGYRYHGRVKALAESARKGGLQF